MGQEKGKENFRSWGRWGGWRGYRRPYYYSNWSYDVPVGYYGYPYNLYGTQAVVVKEETPQETDKPKLNMSLIYAFAGLLAFLILVVVILVATRGKK